MIADLAETPEGSDAAENPIRLDLMFTPIKPNLVEASPLGKQGQKGAINKINFSFYNNPITQSKIPNEVYKNEKTPRCDISQHLSAFHSNLIRFQFLSCRIWFG